MSCCADMKMDQVWVCESCGLEIKIVKKCTCSHDESGADACGLTACLTCCGKPLKLKS
jgi:hypothetical protein